MRKLFIIAFFAAIGLGFVLLNPWAFAFYLIFLAIATAIVMIIVVHSLVKRTKVWKTALLCLAIGYTTALTSYSVQTYLSFRLVKSRDHIIATLYGYRNKNGRFPPTIQEVLRDIHLIRTNYVPDSTLQNFTFYTKDFYGMPWVFTSKDSTWTR